MGIEPFRRFIEKSRANRLFKFPTLVGIGPCRLLLNAISAANFVRFPIDDGMRPDK
uniref:Uncharacterized protein n=1 Tax=Arundo donax TaxID=35708 RepID=A0A0A9AUB6_ARUDO